ncbi:anther-specific proline-rich protein APG [Iris pallida]|uniref:Anther-specific proline-rich protein APG n=1 Tax=Iris pallida TaxID=29817 RepID=A0AAX6G547_IRIPA|nr:anther-specific proline-rich protein APG [Iris pallida]
MFCVQPRVRPRAFVFVSVLYLILSFKSSTTTTHIPCQTLDTTRPKYRESKADPNLLSLDAATVLPCRGTSHCHGHRRCLISSDSATASLDDRTFLL